MPSYAAPASGLWGQLRDRAVRYGTSLSWHCNRRVHGCMRPLPPTRYNVDLDLPLDIHPQASRSSCSRCTPPTPTCWRCTCCAPASCRTLPPCCSRRGAGRRRRATRPRGSRAAVCLGAPGGSWGWLGWRRGQGVRAAWRGAACCSCGCWSCRCVYGGWWDWAGGKASKAGHRVAMLSGAGGHTHCRADAEPCMKRFLVDIATVATVQALHT